MCDGGLNCGCANCCRKITLAGAEKLGLDGENGRGYAATSATSNLIALGSKTFTLLSTDVDQLQVAYLSGSRIRFSDTANPTVNWMEGVATAMNVTTGVVTVTIDTIFGSGTKASWNVSIAGIPGFGYDAVTTTIMTIALGSVTLTTNQNKAYEIGSRVRIASVANPAVNFQDGVVTAYSPSTGIMIVLIDLIGTVATAASWTISIAGQKGANGTNSTIILFNNLAQTDSGDTGGVLTTFLTANIPANTLIANGDRVCIQAMLACASTVFTNVPSAVVLVDGNFVSLQSYSFTDHFSTVEVTIDRISSSSYVIGKRNMDQSGGSSTRADIVTGVNFANPIAVEVQANTNGNAGGIICRGLYAEVKHI